MARRQPAGARVRGHPLGRPRNARPDRVPGAVGARRRCCSSAWRATSCSSAAPSWGGGRRDATSILLEPLTVDETRELVAALLPERRGDAERGRARSPSAPAATRSSPRRWCAAWPRRAAATRPSCPTRCRRCSPRGSTRSSRSSAGWSSTPRSSAARSGRARWRRWPTTRAATCARRSTRAAGEGHRRARTRAARLAGEREFAFKHVLIRDVAYGMLPKAVRCAQALRGRQLHRGARRRPHRRGRRAAGRALRPRGDARRRGRPRRTTSSQPIHAQGAALPRGGGRRRRRALLEPRGLRRTTSRRASLTARTTPATRRADRREAGRRRAAAWAASTRRSSVWEECLEYHRRQEDLDARRRPAPQDRRRRSWHKGERKQAIEHYQKGINLLKDGPPCLELVRLYEEAASLYMHAGDNMLAIYASEKALRLAERLGETRAASRAHGIFGRVFGRIGDTAKARENLERSVELARDSDDGETIRALLDARPPPRGLRGRLRRRRARPTREALDAGAAGRRPARAGRAARRRSPSSPSTAPTGTRSRRSTEASADLAEREGLVGKLCFPYVLRGAAALARRRLGRGRAPVPARARAGRAGRLVRGGLLGALLARGARCATAATTPAPSTELDRALDVCERAGLIAPVDRGDVARGRSRWRMAGKAEQAREAAEEAGRPRRAPALPGRARPPRSRPTARPPRARALELLREAPSLDGARPPARRRALRAAEAGRGAAPALAEALERAAAEYESLGVRHQAERARDLAAS